MLRFAAIIFYFGSGHSGGSPSVAWSTLIGAVVGGALSLIGTVLVERRRGKNAELAERRGRQVEGKLAARLIVAELEDAQSVLRVVLARERYSWPPSDDFEFQTAAWDAHAAALAAAVPDSEWELASAPYFSFRYTNLLGDLTQDSAEKVLAASAAATKALKEWIGSIDES
jgi:hypothetical protein